MSAAFWLSRKHDVTLFEKNKYVGGHTNTIVIENGPDAGTAVDTGFIVCNDRCYPTFHKFLKELEVPVRFSDMSFGYHCEETGLQYSGRRGMRGLFAQKRNAVRPWYWRMLSEVVRFGRETKTALEAGELEDVSLGDYLKDSGYGAPFRRHYLLPMGSAIWSTPSGQMLSFPAQTLARFFDNHGLLDLRDRPQWQTVVGGSHSYIKAFLKRFSGDVVTGKPAVGVKRDLQGVSVRFEDGESRRFDNVVIAAHADQAHAMLEDPSEDETRLLGPWRYERNRTILHTDVSVLPPIRGAWASWNYFRASGSDEERATMTYDMNNLQGLQTKERYCVTLNPEREIDPARIIREINYMHPLFTAEAVRTQNELPSLQGKRRTYFVGSYHGYGFHEDAVRSAATVAGLFGVQS